jgi:hypothetical protein
VNKLTHIWRGQGERELDEQLVPMSNIAHMTGHASSSNNDSKQQMGATTSQVMSYITNPPVDAVVGRAPPRSNCPACTTVEVSDILLSSIPQVEKLIINLAKVTSKRRQCTSYKEVKAGQLVTACGTLNGILNDIKDTILGLASHPVDPDNLLILQDMPTIGEQHLMNSNSTIRDILVQPFFQSDLYTDICGHVKLAKDASLSMASHHADEDQFRAQTRTALSLIMSSMSQMSSSSSLVSLYFNGLLRSQIFQNFTDSKHNAHREITNNMNTNLDATNN